MTTDDIKAAAERVRRVRHNGESLMVVYGSLTVETCGEAELEITHDVHRLADAYLTEHQADDDEPITDKWLSTMYDAISIEGITFVVLVMNTIDNIRTKLMVTMTRGQVRSLLRAMGVKHE